MAKRILPLLLCMVLLAGMTAGCGSRQASEETDVIKIGAVFPMSGEVATFGQSSKNALDMLVEAQNAKGGLLGKKIRIIYEDDENKPEKAAEVLQKLIDKDKIVAVIGSASSDCCLAMGPIATQNGIPMIASTATNPDVTYKGGEYVYRACFVDSFQGQVIAKFATRMLKAKRAAVLYDASSDYSTGLAEFFKESFENAGGTVVAYESYQTNDKDFTAQIAKIRPQRPEVVLLADNYNVVGEIAKQARDNGIKSIFLGGDGWDAADFFKVCGDNLAGGYFSNHYAPDDTSPMVMKFKKTYEEKYKSTPDSLAALAYDAGTIMLSAIERAGSTDGAKIKDALQATDMEVVTGKISYDEERNPIKGAVMIKVLLGKYRFAAKINP